MTQRSHYHAQRDIDHVVTWTATIREACQITRYHTKGVLISGSCSSDSGIQTGHFRCHQILVCTSWYLIHTRETGQEGGDQIGLVVRLTEPISDAEIRVRPSPQCRREGCP